MSECVSGSQSGAFFQNAPRSTKSGHPNREVGAFCENAPTSTRLRSLRVTMAALLSCPDCGKAFRNGAAMRKHAQTHAPKGQFPCQHCPKLLKTKDSLRKHFNTKHNNSYEHLHQCPVCDKRFQNRRKMVQHHGTHNADDETAQRAAGRVLGAEVTRLIAQAIRGGSPAEVCHASPTVTCTTCKGRAPRDDPALFTCSACSKAQHWTCGGLTALPNRPLPSPKCVACLEHAGKSPSTLAEAALGRAEACGNADSTSRRCNPPARRQGHQAGRSS